MAVTTSVPALAIDSEDFTAMPVAASSRADGAQSVQVAPNATVVAVVRDGYTVAEVPEPVPPIQAASAGYGALTEVLTGGGSDSGQLSDQEWALPVAGFISDAFGPRPNRPVAGVGLFHKGTDIAASCGLPVAAATAGTVVAATWNGSYGNWVLIDHGDGVQTGYAHNSTILVSEGQAVAAGETIAEVGNTGASSGCHVHFETRVDGSQIDPESFMNARGITLG